MALSQEDRISISRKIAEIPLQDAQANKIDAQLQSAKDVVIVEDNANKKLQDDKTALINPYQSEVERYDGNGRNQVLEQDIVDSANKKLQNFFFPNDPNTPLPSIPAGVWANFVAFMGNKAIGKQYNETYATVQKEQDLIDDINTQITIIEALSDPTRSTGQECIVSPGSCSNPIYTDETACDLNGGIWTPGVDTIQNHAGMQQAAIDMKAAVQAWEDFMNTTYGFIPTIGVDPDVGRQVENDAARQDITDSIVVVDTWQLILDFDTSHGQTTCVGFDGINVSLLNPTKFRAAEMQPLKDEMTARAVFIATRITQLEGYLGSVTQDINSGEITAASGFYGIRARIIDMRLNLMGGTQTKLAGFDRGQGAQQELKNSNVNAGAVYKSIVTSSSFRSPSTGIESVHVLDATGFNPGDSVWVVSNSQNEILTTIVSIDGNRIVLATKIPKKYRETDLARVYKEL